MEFISGALAAAGACVFSNPFDVIKTRFQLQGELKSKGQYTVHYKSFVHAFYIVAKTDGLSGLQKGLLTSLSYQVLLNGTRLGVYQFAEDRKWTLDTNGKRSIFNTICIGTAAGVLGAYIGSPLYLVKTHLQSKATASIAVGHQHEHQNMFQGLVSVYRKDGVLGLWRGVFGSCVRLGAGSAPQITGFYVTREFLEEHKIFTQEKSFINLIVASGIGGFAASVCMNPFDVISTRLYNQGIDKNGRGLLYDNYSDCVKKCWQAEGIAGLYKGFIPQLTRIGPHSILTLVFWDLLKDLQKPTIQENKGVK